MLTEREVRVMGWRLDCDEPGCRGHLEGGSQSDLMDEALDLGWALGDGGDERDLCPQHVPAGVDRD